MRSAVRLALVGAVVAGVLLVPAVAGAHPLGNFTINTSAGIVVTPDDVWIEYVVDMAEIPTVQVRPELDTDRDGTITDTERSAYAVAAASELVDGLALRIDGAPTDLRVGSARAALLPGQGGLQILRLEATFGASLGDVPRSLTFQDRNFPDRVGWHEITARGDDGILLVDADVPSRSLTDRLRAYPDDMLSAPLDVRTASASVTRGEDAGWSTVGGAAGTVGRPDAAGGAFAELIGRTGPWMALALALAFAFGCLHALAPGHGKTLMAAYLVGSNGRPRQALAVGVAVAAMHTASVLGVALLVVGAASLFPPERMYPWLGLVAGATAITLGSVLLVRRLWAWRSAGPGPRAGAEVEGHHHGSGAHTHRDLEPLVAVPTAKGMVALATAGGILPSPTALLVLLGSLALHRVVYGLALIGMFSMGMATALVIVGIVVLRAREIVVRRIPHRAAALLPVLSATAIAVAGVVVAMKGIRGL